MKEIWDDDTNKTLFKVFSQLKEEYSTSFPSNLEDVDEFFENEISEEFQQDVVDAWVRDMETCEQENSLQLYEGKNDEDWEDYKREGSLGTNWTTNAH